MSERYTQMITGAAVMAVMAVADRTGLLRWLAGRGPVTPSRIVAETGLNARLVQEMLATLCAAGFVDYAPEAGTYDLQEEAAACIADEQDAHFLGGWSQILPALYRVIPALVEACRTDGGVAYPLYGADLVEGMARTSRPEVEACLVATWLPALPGLLDALQAGIAVAEIGCGCGDAILTMARAWPRSSFVGFDTDSESLARAHAAARASGVENARFARIEQSGRLGDAEFDFMLAIDVIHDVAHPRQVLARVREALRPGGRLLLLEPDAGDRLEDNLHPGGALLYAMSTMHCTPISLAEGGEGVGAAWGPRSAEACCREAGFSRFRRLPIENAYNAFYEVS
ncbi:Methyltransferase type 12 [Haliangium ochraceum DSM 14365]|uniref:Methyltransferase type 12 n=2 Tax=Haliangium ochraceum TaxID=80816 RepID=D0LTF3_HALO1|nr:Methyltransferase type 12 [Haliangium ochraceum DSM 14365]